MQLVMGDICGGSKTVDMVKKVLKWKTRPESKGLWQELSDSNRLFQQYMVQWSLMDGSVVSPTENSHTNIKYVIESIRRAHRRMRIAYQYVHPYMSGKKTNRSTGKLARRLVWILNQKNKEYSQMPPMRFQVFWYAVYPEVSFCIL